MSTEFEAMRREYEDNLEQAREAIADASAATNMSMFNLLFSYKHNLITIIIIIIYNNKTNKNHSF